MVRAMWAVLLVCLYGCGERSPTVITGQAMGTRYHITLRGDHPDPERVQQMIAQLLEDIEQQASQWREESWVSRFNQSQSGVPMPAPAHVSSMLQEAAVFYQQTHGVFDVTASPVIELWGFGAERAEQKPSEMQIAEALMRCGFDKLDLNKDASIVAKSAPGLELDFSGMAKGYAVDRMAELLVYSGAKHFVIAFGGEVRAVGDGPSADGWVVEINADKGHALTLRDQACATSGGSEQNRILDGGAVTHLIDPRTGKPMKEPRRSVTVIAGTCTSADAWATALAIDLSLQPPEGIELKSCSPH